MSDIKDIKKLLQEAIKALDERTEINVLFESLKQRFGSDREVQSYLRQAFATQDFKVLKGIMDEIRKGMDIEELQVRIEQHNLIIKEFTSGSIPFKI